MVNFNVPNRTPIFHAFHLCAIENCRLRSGASADRRIVLGNKIIRLSAESRYGFEIFALKISPEFAALIFSAHGETGFVRH
jgi:hypothetical protein